MLRLLQILALVLVGVINTELSLWAIYTEHFNLLSIIVPLLLAYAGLLTRFLFGQTSNWNLKVFQSIWHVFLSDLTRARLTVLISLVIAIVLGIVDYHSSLVNMSGILLEEGKPAKGQFDVRVIPKESLSSMNTKGNVINLKVKHQYINTTLLISAEGEESETVETTELKVLRNTTFKINVIPKEKTYTGKFAVGGEYIDGPFTVTVAAAGKPPLSLATMDGDLKLKLGKSDFPVYILGNSENYHMTEPFQLDSKENIQFLIPVIKQPEPAIRISKLSTIPDEGFRFGHIGDSLLFAQDPTRDSRVLFLRIRLESDSQIPKYVKHASVKVLKYERPTSAKISGRYAVTAFQINFASTPTDAQLTEICKQYKVNVRNKLDEIITFNVTGDFYESDLERLSHEPNVNSATVLSYGRAYSDAALSQKTHR